MRSTNRSEDRLSSRNLLRFWLSVLLTAEKPRSHSADVGRYVRLLDLVGEDLAVVAQVLQAAQQHQPRRDDRVMALKRSGRTDRTREEGEEGPERSRRREGDWAHLRPSLDRMVALGTLEDRKSVV